MKKFLAATKNKGKIREISEILKDFPYEVLSMESVGIDIDIEETGSTFEENALIKAKEINRITGEIVMADDSGLEVDFLNGAPVYIPQDLQVKMQQMKKKQKAVGFA
jgi:XTP/dITP diphosphohydrolase